MNRETISVVAIIALAYFVVASTSVIHWSQWLALGAMIMLALWIVRDDWFYKRQWWPFILVAVASILAAVVL